MIFFVLSLGLRSQRYSANTKRYPPKKVFGNSEFCSSHQNQSRPNSLENGGFGGKNKTQSFQKLFVGGYLFVFVDIFATAAPKLEQKYQNLLMDCSYVIAFSRQNDWTSLQSIGCYRKSAYNSLSGHI